VALPPAQIRWTLVDQIFFASMGKVLRPSIGMKPLQIMANQTLVRSQANTIDKDRFTSKSVAHPGVQTLVKAVKLSGSPPPAS
jgi:hypothetical protein